MALVVAAAASEEFEAEVTPPETTIHRLHACATSLKIRALVREATVLFYTILPMEVQHRLGPLKPKSPRFQSRAKPDRHTVHGGDI
jgi:hypothetical protein